MFFSNFQPYCYQGALYLISRENFAKYHLLKFLTRLNEIEKHISFKFALNEAIKT